MPPDFNHRRANGGWFSPPAQPVRNWQQVFPAPPPTQWDGVTIERSPPPTGPEFSPLMRAFAGVIGQPGNARGQGWMRMTRQQPSPDGGAQSWDDMQASRAQRIAEARKGLVIDPEFGIVGGLGKGTPMAGGAKERMLDAVLGGQDIRFGGLNGPMPYSGLRDNVARVPGGYRVHPMTPTFGGPMPAPPPAWTGPQGVPGGDPAAAAAFLQQRVAQMGSGTGGGPVRMNFDANGVPNGFNAAGGPGAARPGGAGPAAGGGGGAGYNASVQLARLNRNQTDPKMMYRLGQDGSIVDPFGNAMSGEDAHRRILGLNTLGADTQIEKMRGSQAARSNMNRERQAALRWNAGMAAMGNEDSVVRGPGRGLGGGGGMDGMAAMPGGVADRAMQGQMGLANRQLDMQQGFLDKQMTPQQQMQMELAGKMLPGAMANMSPEQVDAMTRGVLGNAFPGMGLGNLPEPQGPGGTPGGHDVFSKMGPKHSGPLQQATDKNDLWRRGVMLGRWKKGDAASMREFESAAEQMQLNTPVADASLGMIPGPVGWWNAGKQAFDRKSRGQQAFPGLGW